MSKSKDSTHGDPERDELDSETSESEQDRKGSTLKQARNEKLRAAKERHEQRALDWEAHGPWESSSDNSPPADEGQPEASGKQLELTRNGVRAFNEVAGHHLGMPELRSRSIPKSVLNRAQMSEPEVRTIVAQMNKRPPGSRGPKANSELAVAAVMSIGLALRAAQFQAAYEELYHGGPAIRWPWMVDGDGPGVTQARKIVKDVCRNNNPEHLINKALAELHNRLVAMGKAPRNYGRLFYVDGSLIPASVPQVMVQGEKARRERWGEHYGHIGPRWYGEGHELVVGYNAVVVTEASTGLPCALRMLPADAVEGSALLDLVPGIFRRMPSIRYRWEAICGDGHYDMSGKLIEALLIDHGLHVIARLTDTHGHSKDLLETGGVPPCAGCGLLMEYRNVENGPDISTRDEWGRLPDGFEVFAGMEVRWHCPTCGRNERTRVLDDCRMHSAYPRHGDSINANVRRIAEGHRNIAESVFSWTKRNGAGGKGIASLRWAGPHAEKWIFALNVLSLVTKRMVLLDGQYEKSAREADRRGDIVNASVDIQAELEAQAAAWAA